MDQAVSGSEMNLTNGVNMESDPESDTFSESGEVSDLNADKLDPTERVLYEKLKQQEREEREEIERELKEHEEAIAMHSNHLRAREKEMHLVQERMQQRSERELDLSRPSSNKSLSNSNGSVNGGDSSNNNGSSSHAGNKPNSNNNSNNNNNLKNSLPCGNNISNIHKSFSNGGSGVGMLKNSCDNTLDMSKFLTEDFRAHLHNSANLLSTFPLGHPLAHAHLALGGHLLGREMKGLEMVNPFHPILPNHSAFPSPPSPSERYPPSSTTPISPTGSLRPSPSPDDPNGENRSHNWTFEEQFKQLYELSEDPKRKEFLDDLFAFMQKRGTPVNRIPIMAKQTLDLYELFRLVVSKGGLVEVINKKLWREITKGLNLPSSITSAAFTLRTQYMKYLYPYECDKLKLSNPSELQAAIDGNRREGRRSSYGYDMSPGPTLVPSSHPLNGGLMNGKLGRSSPLSFDGDRPDVRHLAGTNTPGLTLNPALMPLSHHIYSSMISEKLRHSTPIDDDSLPPTPLPAHHRGLTERDALAMEAASRAMEEATRKMEQATRASLGDDGPPRKRMLTENDRILPTGLHSAHFKITSRNDGRSEIDTSLVVSMEINGIMYQGVLFAQHPHRLGV
ncbi:AT-rich interactive domain-containing protein 3A-like isoform X4 [Biomphalaria glabrata]|uniref:AT-rich interactive domain-containing protein 3A-like isoform X4 n=1 Tax=Biomphalaria glabrata TaxID=6526 RepID=A0A9W3AA28_BIOGL|nr:AT-rich interactive domain-containing protein 3A-like isoform X4 [Biomphalaria glabrata]